MTSITVYPIFQGKFSSNFKYISKIVVKYFQVQPENIGGINNYV